MGRAAVVYYAMGGGLGHLVRARAVLHTLGLEDLERFGDSEGAFELNAV